LAADGIINEVLILAGHAVPRPAVTLTDLLGEAGMPAKSSVEALERWDADRLAMALHADPKRAERLRDWGATRGFAVDLGLGEPDETGETQKAADWRNQVLRALEAGRKAGSGIGKLGAILADLGPAQVPWEVQLRGLMARALTERPKRSWRRPSGAWLAAMAEAERAGGPVPVYEPGRARMDARPRLVVGLDTSSSIEAQMLSACLRQRRRVSPGAPGPRCICALSTRRFSWKNVLIQAFGQGLRDQPLRKGGGTDYADLFGRAGHLAPSLLVVLTDLDAPLPPAPGFGVLWAVPRPVEPAGLWPCAGDRCGLSYSAAAARA
jgi:hypothetical protein